MRTFLAAFALAAFIAAVSTPRTAAGADAACTDWTPRTVASNLGSLENIEFDGTGGLLLSASGPQAIVRMTPDGQTTTLIPNVNAPGGQRVVGRTLYFNTGDSAQSGLMGTPDGTLDSFDLDTRTRTTIASGLTMPNGLAILPNGDFVVSRDIGTGTGITRIPHDDPGHPQTNWAKLDDQNGMAVDPTGTFLYAVQTFTQDSAVYRIRISDPSDMTIVATLSDPAPKGLDDMTIDPEGILYVAANLTGEAIRVDPATGEHCVIAGGMQNTSALKFGRGPGWRTDSLYVTGFDGVVRELTPPPSPGAGGGSGNGGNEGGAGKKRFVRLSIRPRQAVAGRRVRFRFTVYGVKNGKRARLAKARVRFGGKSAHTGRRGRAAITVRFRHAGRKTARASKAGYRTARKAVRVR
jgi:sugar lactone lactonase YvrE